MTATDELRRMLDELRKLACDINEQEIRSHSVITLNQGQYNRQYRLDVNHDWLNAWHAEFERILQAIAATLGHGECRNVSKVMDEHGQARFACSECGAWIDSRMLWNPEYRNGESPWVSGCKLNFCPNCGRRIVDPTTNDVDAEVTNG